MSLLLLLGISGAAPFSGILDAYGITATAAYSLRKLRAGYSGQCVNIRRSSDNATSDIGFDASGNFDQTAFAAFVGGGTGYVVTWYDQSGNGYDVTQATAARQPILSPNVYGTKPSITRAGLTDYDWFTATGTGFGTYNTGNQSVISVAKLDANTGGYHTVVMPGGYLPGSGFLGQGFMASTSDFGSYQTNTGGSHTALVTMANPLLRSAFCLTRSGGTAGNGGTVTQQVRNSSINTSASGTQSWATTAKESITIGRLWESASAGVNAWVGRIEEIILIPSDISSVKSAMLGSVNDYWGIW